MGQETETGGRRLSWKISDERYMYVCACIHVLKTLALLVKTQRASSRGCLCASLRVARMTFLVERLDPWSLTLFNGERDV